LWTFGAAGYVDSDGWTATRGTMVSKPGHLALLPDANGDVVLVSPPELMIDPSAGRRVVLLTGASPVEIRLWGRATGDASWRPVGEGASGEIAIRSTHDAQLDQLRIDLKFRDATPVVLTRVAIVADPALRQRVKTSAAR
jgi:hypothetical protein